MCDAKLKKKNVCMNGLLTGEPSGEFDLDPVAHLIPEDALRHPGSLTSIQLLI